jgi:hypothetical protein
MRLAKSFDRAALADLVARRDIGLVMIYDEWFVGAIPPSWTKLAQLETSQVTAASGKVAFYVTPAARPAAVEALLRDFGKTLPAGARLNFDMYM